MNIAIKTETLPKIKCVVWDLDNTVWNGILSEGDNLVLRDKVESTIKELDNRGILQSISSKNNYDDCIEKLKQFGLEDYFLYPQISWNSKSSAIAEIKKNLNIGFDTIAFVDDQPFELDEVISALPDVRCIDANQIENILSMESMTPEVKTSVGASRRKMYQAELVRKNDEKAFEDTPEEFIKTLGLKCSFFEPKEQDLGRAEELTVRTNQLNTTGITYDYDELLGLLHDSKFKLIMCSLEDKYGSYGNIGLCIIEEVSDSVWQIKLMLMSCRVMSRGIGNIFISFLNNKAKEQGKRLQADFIQNEKNRQMLIVYRFAGFKEVEHINENHLILEKDINSFMDFPEYVEVNLETELS